MLASCASSYRLCRNCGAVRGWLTLQKEREWHINRFEDNRHFFYGFILIVAYYLSFRRNIRVSNSRIWLSIDWHMFHLNARSSKTTNLYSPDMRDTAKACVIFSTMACMQLWKHICVFASQSHLRINVSVYLDYFSVMPQLCCININPKCLCVNDVAVVVSMK